MNYTGNARLVGLYGPGGSLIPDEFFNRDIDFITSFHITDPVRFSDDMINDHDMEFSIRTTQKQYMFMRPLAKTGVPQSRESCGRLHNHEPGTFMNIRENMRL